MKAFLVVFSLPPLGGGDAIAVHLKSFSRFRELMPGVWIVVSSKQADELLAGVSKHLPASHNPCAVFRVDGQAIDWQAEGISPASSTWLFENLSLLFPKIR